MPAAPTASPLKRQQVFNRLTSPVKTRDDLLRLFVSDLGYERVERPIPVTRETFGEGVAYDLAQQCRPIRLAEAGGFHILYTEFGGPRLDLWQQRVLATKLLETFPDSLFAFARADTLGDTRGAEIHLVNVKATDRQVFRRFKLGPSERYRTTAERLALLDLTETPDLGSLAIRARHDAAFDVESVTRQFFKDFCNLFDRLCEELARLNKGLKGADAEREAQTLLDRLVFLYFIQRKGWLNRQRDYLVRHFREHFAGQLAEHTYYEQFLAPVFRILSTEWKRREAPSSHLPPHDPRHHDLPFLNGGLFADELGAEHLEQSVRRHHDLRVSNQAFAHIFDDLLEGYNFTVREDTPLNQEVAIDPEMLGKIFEALVLQLEQSGTGGKSSRHDTGSHYTPRPYVHYLCRDALAAWLENQPVGADVRRLGSEASIEPTKPGPSLLTSAPTIPNLLSLDAADGIDPDELATLNAALTPEAARALADRLLELRACDLGVGSGAFPVALLHELVNLARLCETRARGKDPVLTDPQWLFDTKTRLIERVIYGVDLQERAIEICKLRLWLSLVVDYPLDVEVDSCERRSFQASLKRLPALPNLDFKIRRANSLVDMIHGQPVLLKNLAQESSARLPLWYGFSAPRNLELHDKAQMLVPLLADTGSFAPVPPNLLGKLCPMASGGFTISATSNPYRFEYLLALLNSRLLFWMMLRTSNLFHGGWITCTKQYFGELPIRPIDFGVASERAEHDALVGLVERILTAKRATPSADTTVLEREIDARVYRLYALTPAEIKLLEDSDT